MIRRLASATASRKRRTAAAAATALLVGAPLLTACGTPHAGAAAVVGGEQITVSALQDRVNAVRGAQTELDNADQVMQQSGNLSDATLYGMILDRVVERAAEDSGVAVTRAELQRFRHAQERAHGGEKTLAQLLLQQQGVTRGEIDTFFRTEVAVQKIARKHGTDLTTPEGQQEVGELLAKTSEKLRIDVNPRYGTWDAGKLTIIPAKDGWIKPSKKQAA